jgi:hypothetical protein
VRSPNGLKLGRDLGLVSQISVHDLVSRFDCLFFCGKLCSFGPKWIRQFSLALTWLVMTAALPNQVGAWSWRHTTYDVIGQVWRQRREFLRYVSDLIPRGPSVYNPDLPFCSRKSIFPLEVDIIYYSANLLSFSIDATFLHRTTFYIVNEQTNKKPAKIAFFQDLRFLCRAESDWSETWWGHPV